MASTDSFDNRFSTGDRKTRKQNLDTFHHRTSSLIASSANEQPPAYAPVDTSSFPRRITGITTEEDKFAFLNSFDTIFVVDDSGSMAGRSWSEVRDVLGAIAPICTSHDPDGIDVYFLNHRSCASGSTSQTSGGYNSIRSASHVQQLFESVHPYGGTPTGSRLHNILKSYIASYAKSADNVKPINVIVITDGCPTDDPESIIVHHARKLDQLEAPPHQVGIQFFQVGKERGAVEALRELDDDLARQGIRDMVDTATWDSTQGESKGLSADGILKVVLGAVVRRLDRKRTRN